LRGAVFTGEREIELMEFPDPTPGPDEVVVEMKASGMCGSDLHQYRRPKSGGEAIGALASRFSWRRRIARSLATRSRLCART
jgi:threonine dehydrogenase-like Zn-dependent dehydrogenase